MNKLFVQKSVAKYMGCFGSLPKERTREQDTRWSTVKGQFPKHLNFYLKYSNTLVRSESVLENLFSAMIKNNK